MAENLVIIGTVLLFIAIALIVIGSLTGAKNAKVGIGGFIGPFPFGWANDPKMLPWIILLTAIIAIIFFVLILKGFP